MRPKSKSYRKRVTAIVDAEPTYVSVVTRGANGSPFNSVKNEDSPVKPVEKMLPRTLPNRKDETMAIKPRKTAAMTALKKNANKRVAGNTEKVSKQTESVILRFELSKKQYADEDAVKEFMEKSDFEGDYSIEEQDDKFLVINSAATDAEVIKSAEVDTKIEGAVAVVAKIAKSEEEESEEQEDEGEGEESEDEAEGQEEGTDADTTTKEEAEEEAESSQKEEKPVNKRAAFLSRVAKKVEEEKSKIAKFDFWAVYDSSSSDFKELLKSGVADGATPSFDDILWTFGKSVRNALQSGDGVAESIGKSATDFTDVVVKLDALFSEIVNVEQEELSKQVGDDKAESLVKWAEGFAAALVTDTETKETVSKSEQKSSNNAVIVGTEKPVDVAKAIQEALAPFAETVKKVSEDVEKLGKRSQVSKSLPASDVSTTENSGDKEKSAKDDDRKGPLSTFSKVAFG